MPATREGATVVSAQVAAQWAHIRGRLQSEFGDVVYRTWLKPMALVAADGDEVTVHLPTRFLRDHVSSHFGARLNALWQQENPDIRRVDLRVGNGVGAITPRRRRSRLPSRRRSKNRSPDAPNWQRRSIRASRSMALSLENQTNSPTPAPSESRSSHRPPASTHCFSTAASGWARHT